MDLCPLFTNSDGLCISNSNYDNNRLTEKVSINENPGDKNKNVRKRAKI